MVSTPVVGSLIRCATPSLSTIYDHPSLISPFTTLTTCVCTHHPNTQKRLSFSLSVSGYTLFFELGRLLPSEVMSVTHCQSAVNTMSLHRP